MPRLMLCLLVATVLSPSAGTAQCPSGAQRAALQRLLVAEDARGTQAEGITPILEGLQSSDTLLRRVAVRAAGRLQRPELARQLVPLLSDPVPSIRAEAANGIAQGLKRVRRGDSPSDTNRLGTTAAVAALTAALARERQPFVVDAMAEALGRLPLADSTEARAVEATLRGLIGAGGLPSIGIAHALYSLAQTRRFSGGLSSEGIAVLRKSALSGSPVEVRRLAVLGLGLVGGLDPKTTDRASRDPDEQIRRLALAGIGSLELPAQRALAQRALTDPSPIVRVAAVGASRKLAPIPDCGLLVRSATRDPHPWVRLIAIDSLGAPCADSLAARTTLTRLIDQPRGADGAHAWQVPSRALEALAHVDPEHAASRIAHYAQARRWEERLAATRAAATVGEAPLLYALSRDPDQNVREAALNGLAQLRTHEADSVFLSGLSAPGYQVVLAAANALAGTTSATALPTLLDALDRLTQQRSENARDPRLAILRRIGELGSSTTSERLRPYLTDFDTTVAATAAAFLTRWSGSTVVAHAKPLPIPAEPLADLFLSKGIQLRVTLTAASGGGSFTVALHPDEAPATAARLIRLARAGFYNGGIFQRVEPNFVVQGGGPGATEYIGDRTFMRDELLWHTHFRGTVGISTRGRDTGDAQLYINVVDNPLLDHEYTVAGTVIVGRGVTERILEGDAIATVEVIGAP